MDAPSPEGHVAFRARHGADAIIFKDSIHNDYRFLSNFYEFTMPIVAQLLTSMPALFAFKTVEAYFQAAKAAHVGLIGLVTEIERAATPQASKALGSASGMAAHVEEHYLNRLRVPEGLAVMLEEAMAMRRARKRKQAIKRVLAEWLADFDARGFMKRALAHKFDRTLHPDLVAQLLQTRGHALGESRGRSKSRWTINREGEPGLLGELLMERRTDLLRSPVPPPSKTHCDVCDVRIVSTMAAGTCGNCLCGTYCSSDCMAHHGECARAIRQALKE